MREAKDRWSAKQGPVKNTHATTSDVGDIIDADDISSIEGEDGLIKVTTSAGTGEVELVGDSFIKKKPPVIINIKKRSVIEVETSESSVTEPAKKRRKVKPAECVNSSPKVSRNLKHTGKGKRSKPADVVTTTQQVAKIVTAHQPEIILQVNMPPLVIQPEILEVPDDLAAIQADLMGIEYCIEHLYKKWGIFE